MYKKKLREYIRRNDIKLNCLEKTLLKFEGFKPKYYYDTKGIQTFGIGHNCEANKLTDAQKMIIRLGNFDERARLSLDLFEKDIEIAKAGVKSVFGNQHFTRNRKNSLIMMVFQMGCTRFKRFKKTIALINAEEWDLVRAEALNSRWGREDKRRAEKTTLGLI